MNISDIRAKYPMYSDLSDQELVDGLHSKFYSDIPKEDFYSKVGYKTPEQKAPPVKTDWMQDIGLGLGQLGYTTKQAGSLALGTILQGMAKGRNDPDFQGGADEAFQEFIDRKKAQEEKMRKYDQGIGGKIISGTTAFLPAVAASAVLGPLPALGIMSGMNAIVGGAENVEEGATANQAVTQAIGEAALDIATARLPIGKGILKGTGLGALGNVISQGGSDALARLTMPENIQESRYKVDPEKYIVAGASGGIPGAILGRMNKNGRFDLPSDTTTESKQTVPNGRTQLPTPEEAQSQIVETRRKAFEMDTRDLEKTSKSIESVGKRLDNLLRDIGEAEPTTKDSLKILEYRNTIKALSEKKVRLLDSIKEHTSILDKYKPEEVPVREEVNQETGEIHPNIFIDSGRFVETPHSTTESQLESNRNHPVEGVRKTQEALDSFTDSPLKRAMQEALDKLVTSKEGEYSLSNYGGRNRDSKTRHVGTVDYDRMLSRFIQAHPEKFSSAFHRTTEGLSAKDAETGETLVVGGNSNIRGTHIYNIFEYLENVERSKLPPEGEQLNGMRQEGQAPTQEVINPEVATLHAQLAPHVEAMQAERAAEAAATQQAEATKPDPAPAEPTPGTTVATTPVAHEYDVTKLLTLDKIKKLITSGRWKDVPSSVWDTINYNWFGDQQWIHMAKQDMPLVYEAWKTTEIATKTAIEQERSWLNNLKEDAIKVGKGVFMKLSAAINPDSVNYQWHHGSDADVFAVLKEMKDAFANNRHHSEQLALAKERLTDTQKEMYRTAYEMFDRIFRDTMWKPKGELDYRKAENYRNGWFPAMRKGNFAIVIKDAHGTPFHFETFHISKEAELLQERIKKEQPNFQTDLINKDTSPTLFDQLNGVQDLFGNHPTPEQLKFLNLIEEKRQQVAAYARLGAHELHRMGYTGYEGNKLYKTDAQNAQDFRKAIFDAPKEYATLYKKRLLSQIGELYAKDADIKKAMPNQAELADQVIRNAMNEVEGFGKKIGVDQDKFHDVVNSQFVKVIDAINKKTGLSLPMPRHNIIDRANGIASQMFFISALTRRPGFWIGNVLSSPFAMRALLYEGRPLDTLTAMGRGMWNVFTGGSPEFRKFIKLAAELGESLTPQFRNEINTIGKAFLDNGKHALLKTLFEYGTGQAPSAIADSISRYITMSIGYEFYKNQYKDPKQLLRNVEHFTDSTMVIYGRQHTAPILQKLGTAGELISPLTKYPTAQLGNLIADFKHMMREKTIKSTLPALSTLVTSMIMGGTYGTALVMEYTFFANIINWVAKEVFGEDEALTPADKAILENTFLLQKALSSTYGLMGADNEKAQEMAALGLPSAVAGFDIGSGVRFQGFISEQLTDPNKGLFDLIPAASFLSDLVTKAGTSMKSSATDAEKRNADLAFQPFIGTGAIIDRFKHGADTRAYVPDTKTGAAVIPQTGKEELATLLGSRTTESFQENKKHWIRVKEEKEFNDKYDREIQNYVDDIVAGRPVEPEKLIRYAVKLNKNADQIQESIENARLARNIPRAIRFQAGSDAVLNDSDLARTRRYNYQE